MSIVLTLLGDVRWRGRAVAGERPRALLAALAARGRRPVPAGELIGLVWGDDAPANGAKGLQVLVSRVRAACGPDAIVRDGAGYRLGAGPDEVDSARLARLVRDAAGTLDRDAVAAASLAREALSLAGDLPSASGGEDGPLAGVLRAAADDAGAARVIVARAASRTGGHATALPALEAAWAAAPHDESLLADLLRSESSARGPAVALERYERYRTGLRDRLGTDPGEPLQRVHRTLLWLDHPVREGVRHDATALIGRDADTERLRALLAGSRVVSITGPGGIGKTRLAHVLAREAAEPSVRVVELAGVTSADDIAAEIGSVLGVRDSVTGRRTQTPGHRADLRARIAQVLAQSPCLLVLDNCEHLIEAVAGLVAYLVTAVPDLRVLTTSRAPLAIAAERAYPLTELGPSDAALLFTERAVAARPGVRLPEPVVARIVARLDGLPLAIELAAAKVRAMSAEEIDRRLEDRFALLRGGDRGAPDRHQTLLAVIEWSWNLLSDSERRALRWLALFPDGFTLPAAEAVLSGDAAGAVAGLAGQSLLSVGETTAGVRYRMLETVREFGRLRLTDAGEETAARSALRHWAIGYALRHGARALGREQFDAIDALRTEETSLADELRAAIADGDRRALVQLHAALGLYWTLRGEHLRMLVLAQAVTEALRDWEPPPDVAGDTRAVAAITLSNLLMTRAESDPSLTETLRRLGPGDGDAVYQSHLPGLVRVLLAFDPGDEDVSRQRLESLAESGDRATAATASQWLGQLRENSGDPDGAARAAERTLELTRDDDGPWAAAMPHSLLAELSMQTGDRDAAVRHARAALPTMVRLGAADDEIQLRSVLVLSAILDGHIAEAADELTRVEAVQGGRGGRDGVGGGFTRRLCQAELALARGDHPEGLRLHRECAAYMRDLRLPGVAPAQMMPWTMAGDSVALAAHARYAAGDDLAHGRELLRRCRDHAARLFGGDLSHFDYPAAGVLMFALGAWGLLRGGRADDAVRLIALAGRFRYTRSVLTMLWERVTPDAEKAAPGLLGRLQADYEDREPADLLAEAGRLAATVLQRPCYMWRR